MRICSNLKFKLWVGGGGGMDVCKNQLVYHGPGATKSLS